MRRPSRSDPSLPLVDPHSNWRMLLAASMFVSLAQRDAGIRVSGAALAGLQNLSVAAATHQKVLTRASELQLDLGPSELRCKGLGLAADGDHESDCRSENPGQQTLLDNHPRCNTLSHRIGPPCDRKETEMEWMSGKTRFTLPRVNLLWLDLASAAYKT